MENLIPSTKLRTTTAVLNSTIRTLLDTHLPERKIRRCSSDRPWIDDNFRYLIRRRQIALLSENQPLYRHYRNKVNLARKSLQRKYYQRKIKSLENEHPKRWWNSVKELVGVKVNCDNLQGLANTHCSGNFSILANEISDFFESVTKDFPPLLPVDVFLPPGADTTVPDAYLINVDEVAISLSRIKTHKATGPDEIPNWILHDYAAILAPPVCAIFNNSSLREGTVPALWKCADVRPVPKIRPPALIEKDLRPISLTPVLSKCLEKFMCTWITDITMDQIDPQQYGSIKGTSTVHALVELVHKWKYAVETPRTIVRILLVDFSKAFDRVDHHILMTKCASLGLPTFITKWMTSFLCQRKQRVKIGSGKSEYTTVNAGVPQGTIFGPIGFLHHINDLQTVCEHIKYADDCTIWEASSSSGLDSSLQVAADEVGQWTASNKMALNYDKTKELRICFKKSTPDIALLTINGRPIQQVNSTRLLSEDLNLSEDLKWQSHIDEIITKASQRLYFIILLKRAGIDPHHLINIYTSIVRSVLEYACQVWHTSLTKKQTRQIEYIQKRAMRFIFQDKSYTEAITAANLPTLSDRREKLCRTLFISMQQSTHKLHHLLPPLLETPYTTRNTRTYCVPRCRTAKFQNSFIPYALRHWQ